VPIDGPAVDRQADGLVQYRIIRAQRDFAAIENIRQCASPLSSSPIFTQFTIAITTEQTEDHYRRVLRIAARANITVDRVEFRAEHRASGRSHPHARDGNTAIMTAKRLTRPRDPVYFIRLRAIRRQHDRFNELRRAACTRCE
jgi:hypothetical protein